MTIYLWTLLLGAAGLAAMALSGIGSHGHAHGSHGAHGHSHGHAHGHSHSHSHSHLLGARGGRASSGARGGRAAGIRTLWALTSPRFLFSLCLGVGTAGVLLRSILDGPLLLAAALVGGAVFERFVVSPLWNFTMRFASTPAAMLESAIASEATAVTSFDANGQGIVAVEVDGQIVQILATLRAHDRQFGGARIRAGQRVHIESVDADRNCCTVSLL